MSPARVAGRAPIALEASITAQGVVVDFTATLPDGTIVGGSGRFATVHGSGLTVSGHAKRDGSRARVRLPGTVSY